MRALTLFALFCACSPGGQIDDSDDPTDATDSTDSTDATDDTDVDPGPPPDFGNRGPARAQTGPGSLKIDEGCTLQWTEYQPDGERGEALVILVHGFARGQGNMAGWASHWASWGAEVITPDMCRLGTFNTDHPTNGRHVAALVKELADGRPTIVAGHSAGGLAAVLGASESNVDGVLLLDPVDNDDLGVKAAGGIAAPIGALYGEASACNAQGNGTEMAEGKGDSARWRVDTSDHCHFESPTDGLCTGFCRRGQPNNDAIDEALRRLSTSFIVWRSGLDERGEDWWTPGTESHDEVEGQISPIP